VSDGAEAVAVNESLPFITWQAVDRLLQLLRECEKWDTQKPHVYPHSEGGLQLEWRTDSGRSIEVELFNGGRVTYFDGGQEPVEVIDVPFRPVVIIGDVANIYSLEE